MKRLNIVLLGTMTATLFCGCIDKDLYDPNYKKENFEAHWNNQFGEIDLNQDWNMATLVKANVDLSSYGSGSVAKIYTTNPVSGGQLIGLASQSTTLSMDVVKGSKYVFATIEQNGSMLFYGYVPVQNGEIKIGGSSRSTLMTRGVSLGEQIVLYTRDAERDGTYTLEEARKVGDTNHWVKVYDPADVKEENPIKESDGCYRLVNIEGVTLHDYYPNHENDYHANQWNYPGLQTSQWTDHGSSDDFPHRLHAHKYQKLTGVETSHDKSWMVADYFSIFGVGAPFQEQADPSNLSKYKDQFTPNVTFTVSGPLTLDYMFGATDNDNVFGYYYWQDGEDPIAATRYVLIDNAQPSNNLTSNGVAIGNMELSALMMNSQNAEKIVTGTSYKVPYFDENGNPSYNFPNNTHIAFFLVVGGMKEDYSNWLNKTNLSVQDHNFALRRTFSGHDRNNSDPDATKGEIDAISFKSGDQIFLGFEDRGGDKDMNDIVFFVNGKVTPDEDIVDITPPKTYPQWIIACEDLGNTDDYDFNDCVFGVSHVAGTTEATVQALAAGGVYGIDVKNGSSLNFEIHEALGSTGQDGSYPMINTTGIVTPGSVYKFTVDSNFTLSNNGVVNMGGFSIEVHSKETTELITAPKSGTAPQMILVPGEWAWPTERTDIRDAYPMFRNWNSNATTTDWCNSPAGKVVQW